MLTEQIQTNNESQDRLFNDIFNIEKSGVEDEYLPMWNAENNACFPHFINYAGDVMSEALEQAKSGDKNAILLLSNSYQDYRTELETSMSEYAPNIYDFFIEAVGRGDSANSAMYVEEYISSIGEGPQKEDDDDD